MSADGTISQLDFTWDPAKAASNAIKHGVTFAQAATVLLDALALTVFDARHSEFEERWFTLGLSSEGKLLAVSHTYYGHGTAPRSGAYHFGARSHPKRTPAVRDRTTVDPVTR